ncbi:MAG: cache domain-containing protein [Bacteroidales bacterium]|jgi:PAS domain S-box-containing protein|nr:cache domain-containing protein [Bacteroidales bacterium]
MAKFKRKAISSIYNKFYFKSAIYAVVCVCVTIVISEYIRYRNDLSFEKKLHIENKKEIIKTEVNNTIAYINHLSNTTEAQMRVALKRNLYNAWSMANNIYEKNKDKLTENQVKSLIKESLRPLRYFNGRGYLFVIDMNGYSIMHPITPDFEDKNIIDLQDNTGKYVIREEIELMKAGDEAFIEYSWSKAGDPLNRSYPKTAFLKRFDTYNWYIGIGEYRHEFEEDIKDKAIEWVETMSSSGKYNLFINHFSGKALLIHSPVYKKGDYINNLTDIEGTNIFELEKEAAAKEDGGFMEYFWKFTPEAKDVKIMSYVKAFKKWDWIIGAWDDGTNLKAIERSKRSRGSLNIIYKLVIILISISIGVMFTMRSLKKINVQIQNNFRILNNNLFNSLNRSKDEEKNNRYTIAEVKKLSESIDYLFAEHMKNVESLAISEKKFNTIIDNAPIMILSTDNNRIIKSWNIHCETGLGLKKEDVLNKETTINNILKKVISEQSAEILFDISENIEVKKIVFNDNREVYHLWRGFKISDDTIIWVGHDVTELNNAERKIEETKIFLNTLLESIPIPIFHEDNQGILIGCNKAFTTLVSKNKHEVMGKKVTRFFPDITNGSNSVNIDSTISYETKYISNGNERIFMQYKAPFYNSSGELQGRINALNDITERVNTENILKDSEKELQVINNTKDKFFSIIAHDLKNPFNTLIGFSELLIKYISHGDYSKSASFAKIMGDSSKHGLQLLSNLLEWSKTQTGEIEFAPTTFNISDMAKDIKKGLQAMVKDKNLKLKTDIAKDLVMTADANMINTIIRNLVSNAIKFSKPEGLITINAKEIYNGNIQMSIADTGIGIPEENIDKLFRIDESYSTKGTNNEKGTGLGLILCQEFIQKHGGKIWVESKVGTGTTFYFTIPQKKRSASS